MNTPTTRLASLAVATTLALAGCANMSDTQRTTAQGAGIGAVAGAVIGAAAGGSRGAATGAVVGAGAGALGGYVWSQRMERQKQQMEQATQGTGIGVVKTADNRLKVNIPSDAGFDTGRADIRPALAPVLDSFANGVRQNPNARVTIIGHTDNTGSDSINNPLSVNRAASTRDYVVARGVPASVITIDGRGSREPVAGNDTVAGRAMNRRVEIFVAEPAPQ